MSIGENGSGDRVKLDLGEEGGDLSLKIDTDYAVRYEKRKRGEELSKLRDKYGYETESYSSDSDLEDEHGKGLSIENDKSFLRVLSLIKQNDASLHDPDAKFYATESDTSISEDESPMFLRDYEREKLLRDGPDEYDSGSELGEKGSSDVLAYNPEQRELKRELLEAASEMKEIRNTQNDPLNESEFLKPRIKSSTEVSREERDYADWLKTNPSTDLDPPRSLSDSQTAELSHLRTFWTQTDLSEEDRFLRDYLLEKKHLGEEGSVEAGSEFDDQDLEQLDAADEFERKYNFRFEEEEGSLIARYPRLVMNSVRREDTRRRDQRQQRNERKESEKIQEREEIKRLKNLKKMEIQDKIELIKKITGNADLGVGSIDVSGDFNAEEYDRQMNSIFNEDYLEQSETTKPDFSSFLPPDLLESDSEQLHCEDERFVMDADYIEENRDKSQPFINGDSVATNSHLTEAIEDYYKLDYADKIGDLNCRMRYREVVPNAFGLTTEEILSAEDRELNQWASLKKTVQFRSENDEKRDVKRYKRKSRDINKKKRTFLSIYKDSPENPEKNSESSKKKSKDFPSLSKDQKRIRMNKKLSESQRDVLSGMPSSRMKAFNINPKKGFRKK